MFSCAKRLYNAGARCVSVACNTAHADRIFSPFCDKTKEALPGLVVVNMLETCAAFVKSELRVTHIGLLATKGTYSSRVYHEYFKSEDGFDLIEPELRGQDRIHEAIYSEKFGIKAYSQPVKSQAKNTIIYEIFRLAERGAEAVILGCTELPLAVAQEDLSLPIIDPGLLTARRLISLTAPEKLIPNV
jgi:aspartate racemase